MSAHTMNSRTAEVWRTAGLFACLALISAAVVVALAVSATNAQERAIVLGARDAQLAGGSAAASQAMAQSLPGFMVLDEDGIAWTSEQAEVNVFLGEYAGEREQAQQSTVATAGADHVVAPGTGNEYSFSVVNDSSVPVTYTLSAEVSVAEGSSEIPLEARVKSQDGYLEGGAEQWVAMKSLGVLDQTVTLDGHEKSDYALEWRWRFERDDEAAGEDLATSDAFDTALGNAHLTQPEEPVANVKLNVLASYDIVPASGFPKTSDAMRIIAIAAIALLALVALAMLLLAKRKKKEREEERAVKG